jgi:hypothetical protein
VAGDGVGGVEGLAEFEGAVAYFSGEASGAEFAGEREGRRGFGRCLRGRYRRLVWTSRLSRSQKRDPSTSSGQALGHPRRDQLGPGMASLSQMVSPSEKVWTGV